MDNREKLLKEIKKTMTEKVDPLLEQHFGNSTISAFENDILYVKLGGACASCPSAQDTVNDVIREIILDEHPEVKDVELDTSVSQDLIDFAKELLSKEKK